MNDLKTMKATYQTIKKKGDEERIAFLDSIVSYCDFLKFTKEKTFAMLGMIQNSVPSPGQSWKDCDMFDDVDIEYNKKIHKKYE